MVFKLQSPIKIIGWSFQPVGEDYLLNSFQLPYPFLCTPNLKLINKKTNFHNFVLKIFCFGSDF